MKQWLFAIGLMIAFFFSPFTGQASDFVDVKVKGKWDFSFGWAQNLNSFKHSEGNRYRKDDNGIAVQRIRTQVHFIASESLQGVVHFEIGNIHWGRGSAGGALGTDGVNIETKHAYLDWVVPSSALRLRMGLQSLALPMATRLGNPVFHDDVAAVVANYALNDTVAVTAFWMRPYNSYRNDDEHPDHQTRRLNDEVDAFGLIVPIALKGVTVTPWAMWANIGDASAFYKELVEKRGNSTRLMGVENKRVAAWWAGLGTKVNLSNPLTLAFDVIYGHLQPSRLVEQRKGGAGWSTPAPALTDDGRFGADGWFIDATLNYSLDWGTPGLFAWWASGDAYSDVRNNGMIGRMPVFNTTIGFGPTTFGLDGAWELNEGGVLGMTGTGTWGIGLQLADVSFINDLSHTLRFAYMRGTNSHKLVRDGYDLRLAEDFYLTNKDQAFEVNFDHTYKIYDNLTAVLELAWLSMDLDKSTWSGLQTNGAGYRSFSGTHRTDDAWKAQLAFQYTF